MQHRSSSSCRSRACKICRRLLLRHLSKQDLDTVWKSVSAIGYKGGNTAPSTPLLRLVFDHIACDRLDTTGWVAPDPRQAVFYRLIKIGTDVAIDLVVDTAKERATRR